MIKFAVVYDSIEWAREHYYKYLAETFRGRVTYYAGEEVHPGVMEIGLGSNTVFAFVPKGSDVSEYQMVFQQNEII